MRIVVLILTVVFATNLFIGGALFLLLQTPKNNTAWTIVAVTAMTIFIVGPVTLGFLRAYRDVRSSEASQRYYRRLSLIVIALEILAAVAIIVYAVEVNIGSRVPAVFIGGALTLTVIAVLVGTVLSRHEKTHPPVSPAWVAIDRRQVIKRVLAIGITFFGVLILATGGFSIAYATTMTPLHTSQAVLLVIELAFFAASFTCVFSYAGWTSRIRDITDRDPARLRQISRVVVRNKPLHLDERDQIAAARFAALNSIIMPFQLAYFSLLYTGLLVQMINLHSLNSEVDISLPMIVFLCVVSVVVVPLLAIRIRRVRRYASTHVARFETVSDQDD